MPVANTDGSPPTEAEDSLPTTCKMQSCFSAINQSHLLPITAADATLLFWSVLQVVLAQLLCCLQAMQHFEIRHASHKYAYHLDPEPTTRIITAYSLSRQLDST